jgi:uncharacterized protein (DUF58 family)
MAEGSRSTEYMGLLPPETTGSLARLELIARGVVEGFISGRHKSPHKGFSVEFAEHRQYSPGDDLRNLDWRVYAKIDRFYIKEYIEETNLRATILLDASASMKYTGECAAKVDGKPLSKFEYARLLAAAMTYLLIRQQDAVGLVTFDSEVRRYIPARCRASQIRYVLEELHRTEPGGETAISGIFHDIAERVHRRGLVVIISDLFDSLDDIIKALHHFRYRRHDVIVLHIMAEEELTFPFSGFTHFRNLEVREHTLPIDPKTLRAHYLERVREFVDKLEVGCGQMRADYVPMTTKEGFDKALAGYLARRRSAR